jgi:hypothetical protein
MFHVTRNLLINDIEGYKFTLSYMEGTCLNLSFLINKKLALWSTKSSYIDALKQVLTASLSVSINADGSDFVFHEDEASTTK